MSNHLAIATVTATLRTTLANVLAADQLGVDPNVTTVRPDVLGSDKLKTGVNLYLYQVVSNPARTNDDLPTRNPDGALVRRPQVALDLHYLVSFYGNDADLEPQRLLGSVARALHARPVLTRDAILKTLQQSDAPPWIAASDLAEQIDRIRLTPLPLSLEELSKIWSVFFQTKYALSVAYAGSVVLIETDDPALPPALPVRERSVTVVPKASPRIDVVRAAAGDARSILAAELIEVVGRDLEGQVTTMLIDGEAVAAQSVSPRRIAVALPMSLSAGPHSLQVVLAHSVGGRSPARRLMDSNVAAFVLRPSVVASSVRGPVAGDRTAEVDVRVSPPVGPTQRVMLLLNAASVDTTMGFRLPCPARATTSDTMTVPIPGVPAGEYFVRVEVDGAQSLVTIDDAGVASGPKVTVP